MKKLIELRQQKNALKNQMRSLLEKADSENRSLNDDEGKQFDELRAKADALDTEISRLESVADEERSKPGTGIQKLSSDELRNYIVTGDVRSLSSGRKNRASFPGGKTLPPPTGAIWNCIALTTLYTAKPSKTLRRAGSALLTVRAARAETPH